MLFETLAEAPEAWTVGGESHQFIEGLRPLNPMSGLVDSNRLEAADATDRIVQILRQRFARSLRDRDGREYSADLQIKQLRFLEKTPKNALRLPFFEKVLPGAFYVHLVRDPRPNISSMMEAWKTGRWVTYPRLPGWEGQPWSLLLPPGWQNLKGCSPAEICAYQWESANRIIMDDLETLPRERWTTCDYNDLTNNTGQTVRRISEFAQLELDERYTRRFSGALPLSRYTQTAPDADKWRKNEREILAVLASVDDTWKRCRQELDQVAEK